jgi:hypothetical protein
MVNNIKPQSPGNVFQHQSHPSNLKRPPRGVMQDKGAEKSGRAASEQPVPLENESGARLSGNKLFRVNKLDYTKAKLIHTTSHLHPLVRAELERRADITGLSLSRVMATGLEEWVQYDLHRQHETLMYPMFRQLIRDELKAFGNRIVFFLMRIAFSAEQARILITNVLHKVLKLAGVPDERFNSIVDESNKMARRNIITKTPQIKSLLKEWEAQEPKEQENEKK